MSLDETNTAQNLIQQAQDRRAKRETHLFLDIPTWDGDLIGEYKILGPDAMKALAEASVARSRNNAEPGSNDIAAIIAMHVGLHILDRETGKRVAITDEFGHVGFDRIAKFLGQEDILHSQADAIKYLTGDRDKDDPKKFTVNIVALMTHASTIQRWSRDPSKRTFSLEEILGEL